MSGAHAAPRDRLHPHRKHEGMGRRIARVAPDIGRGIIAGLTFAAVLSTAGSGAQATPEQKSPGIEILTPGMFEHAGAKLGKLARAAAMRQDIASIRSFAFGRARR